MSLGSTSREVDDFVSTFLCAGRVCEEEGVCLVDPFYVLFVSSGWGKSCYIK